MKSGLDLSLCCWVCFGFSWRSFFVYDTFQSRFFEFLCFFRCLICFFALFLFLGCFSSQTGIFGSVYGQTKNFRSTPVGLDKKNKKYFLFFSYIWLKILKLFMYFFNLKYFNMFLKNIAWIAQQICKFPKDFGLYFKNIKKHLFCFF
jgi:hypothetical protein